MLRGVTGPHGQGPRGVTRDPGASDSDVSDLIDLLPDHLRNACRNARVLAQLCEGRIPEELVSGAHEELHHDEEHFPYFWER